jgi:hypothetical protein
MGLFVRGAIGWRGFLAAVLVSAAGAALPCVWAQAAPQPGEAKTAIVMPPTPLLPTNDKLALPGADFSVPDDSGEARSILKEDGLTRTEGRVGLEPTASHPAQSGWVKAYEFVDATGAFSAYTYFRQGGRPYRAGGKPINATEIETADGEIVFLSGVSVVRARLKLYPESLDATLAAIDVGLPKIGGRKGLAPLLPTMLPADVSAIRLDPFSVRYALGPVGYQAMGGVLPADILGWDKSAEVATANYAGHGSKGTLTLLLYPTPQIAGDRGRAIEKAINTQGPATFGTVKARRVGPLVGVTSGGLTPEQAQVLVTALHLDEIVTFDKPMPLEFHAEVKKTATLLQSIAIFTGVLILAAIVIGVFLGGARAGIRVLRGKPAASEPEFLTINLRDEPKALFVPKDGGPDKPSA